MRLIGSVTTQHDRRQSSVEAGALSIGLALSVLLSCAAPAAADTPQQTCDRLAGDTVPLERVDAAGALAACAEAVQAAPGTPRLEYEYGRALEKSGSVDPAKQMYQWASDDGFAPATAALARINAQPASATMSESESRRKTASQLDALADIAGTIAKTAPRDHDDPIAVLELSGLDPAAILKWVQTNTRLLPYVGTLRGSAGVLMDRAGNSLDRSLLLADLLHRAGYEVRLARAQLDPQAAAALRTRMAAAVPKPELPAPPSRAELLKQIGNDPRLDRAMVETTVDQAVAEQQRFDAQVRDLYGKVLPAVMKALGNDSERDRRLVADVEAALRDHFWVQRREANGWQDLDADADVLHQLAPAETLEPDRIPDALKHRVTLRLTLETWKAGKLSETKLLEQSWTPSELLGKSITLDHSLLPQEPLEQLAKQPDADARYVAGLTKAWVVQPVLRVGDATAFDQLYTLGGQVLPAGAATLSRLGVLGSFANFGKLQSGLDQAFGNTENAASHGPPDEATAAVKVMAEWLDIDVAVPNRPVEHNRRAIFDLLGPSARAGKEPIAPPTLDAAMQGRRAMALSGSIAVYVFGATPSEKWIQRIDGEDLSAAASSVATGLRTVRTLGDMLQLHPQMRTHRALSSWALSRRAAGGLGGSLPTAPNVALYWETPVVTSGSPTGSTVTFDIVSNDAADDAIFSERVTQGILDTVVEQALLPSVGPATNTAAQMAGDLARGQPWAMVAPDSADAVDALALPSSVKLRMKADLAAGNFVIAPPTEAGGTADVTWWRIDVRTGRTLGVDAQGRGDAMVSYADILRIMLAGVCQFKAVRAALVGNYGDAFKGVLCVVGAGAGLAGPEYGALGAVVAIMSQLLP
jgi:hypothetical protein